MRERKKREEKSIFILSKYYVKLVSSDEFRNKFVQVRNSTKNIEFEFRNRSRIHLSNSNSFFNFEFQVWLTNSNKFEYRICPQKYSNLRGDSFVQFCRIWHLDYGIILIHFGDGYLLLLEFRPFSKNIIKTVWWVCLCRFKLKELTLNRSAPISLVKIFYL